MTPNEIRLLASVYQRIENMLREIANLDEVLNNCNPHELPHYYTSTLKRRNDLWEDYERRALKLASSFLPVKQDTPVHVVDIAEMFHSKEN
jgi:hypothetical protein